MSDKYSDKVHYGGARSVSSLNEVKLHADLVQRGLQTRVRAIMAIYGIDREEAQKVLVEINDENFEYGAPPRIPFPEENQK